MKIKHFSMSSIYLLVGAVCLIVVFFAVGRESVFFYDLEGKIENKVNLYQRNYQTRQTRNFSELLRSASEKMNRSVVSIQGEYRMRSGEWKLVHSGTGFIVDAKRGLVVTNSHVVEQLRSYKAEKNEKFFPLKLLGRDPDSDIAVLRFLKGTPRGMKQVTFGDSNKIQPGDFVLAMGSPHSYHNTITMGIISAKSRRNKTFSTYGTYIQTDAAINPGNSGGPLFDLDGNVLGINAWIVGVGGGSNGLGFAIAISDSFKIIQDLAKYGKVQRGWIGVEVEFVKHKSGNTHIIKIEEDSPAAKDGLKIGDIILRCNGTKIKRHAHFEQLVQDIYPKKYIEVIILRKIKGKERMLRFRFKVLLNPND